MTVGLLFINPFLVWRNDVGHGSRIGVVVERFAHLGSVVETTKSATSVPSMPGGGDLVSDSILKVPLGLVCASVFSSACTVAEGDAWDRLSEALGSSSAARIKKTQLIAHATIATKVKKHLIGAL